MTLLVNFSTVDKWVISFVIYWRNLAVNNDQEERKNHYLRWSLNYMYKKQNTKPPPGAVKHDIWIRHSGNKIWWEFYLFFSYYIQHCFIYRPSDSTVPTDAGIEPRTVATGALAVRRSNHYLFAGFLFLLILPVLLVLRVLYITQYC
jgi:hypothetical protein